MDLDAIAQHLREELETKTRVTEVVREALLDSLPDLVMVMDDDGTIRKVNLVFEELTGLSPKAALGRLCFDPGGTTPEATGCERDFCPKEVNEILVRFSAGSLDPYTDLGGMVRDLKRVFSL